jgi:hypothetical protein
MKFIAPTRCGVAALESSRLGRPVRVADLFEADARAAA